MIEIKEKMKEEFNRTAMLIGEDNVEKLSPFSNENIVK